LGRVRIAVARRFLLGCLPVVALLASAIDRPVFAADRFPLALKDDRGVTVRLAAPPRRIVSLAPSLTEIVFLLGRERGTIDRGRKKGDDGEAHQKETACDGDPDTAQDESPPARCLAEKRIGGGNRAS